MVIKMEDLTREMVMAEVPGPQLDHWVAENIMTIPQLYAYTHCAGENQAYYWKPDEEDAAIRDRALSVRLPNYSTDIAEAWKVIEELNSRGLSFNLKLDAKGGIRVEGGPDGLERSKAVFDDREYLCTVPEAICKTALLMMLMSGNHQ